MLLAIAVFPLWLPRWWESNRNKLVVSLGLGLPILALYAGRAPGVLLSTAEEYVSFIVLLSGLFVISAGIHLRGDLAATPLTNTAFLGLGSVLASFIGTTGAAMLLIRPLLQTNRERTRVRHTIVFFIFLVCNIGGMRRSNAEIIREYGPFPGVDSVAGVTYDGQNVWFAAGDKLTAFDPATGKTTRSIDVAAHAGTAFDGQHLYQLAEDRIHKIDPKTGRVLGSIPAPGGGGDSGLA